jgi:hypothetical protein
VLLPTYLVDGSGACTAAIALVALTLASLLLAATLASTVGAVGGLTVLAVALDSLLFRCASRPQPVEQVNSNTCTN